MSARVDPAAARAVAAAYVDTPRRSHPLATAAYAQLTTESDRLFRRITAPDRPGRVRVAFTRCPRPYATARELIASVRVDRLLEVVTVAGQPDQRHPLMGSEAGGAYDRFRAVHDVLGHARLRLGFDRDGEFAAWRSQERFHGRLARRALATELHGRHSVLWTTGDLAEPKAIVLDPRLVRRSVTASLPRFRPTTQAPPTKGPLMKIVVIGGTGLIGSKVVAQLLDHGHEAVPASPDSGVDTLTGEGVADVLQGASVVVDVSNSPSFEDAAVLAFFETSTRNLLDAEAAAGVGHHVALSVVGTDRLSGSGYMRAKIAQEKLIRGSTIPYSIVHATQFFEFAGGIADASTDGDTVRLPPVLFQPMAAAEVSAAVARVAAGDPLGGMVEVAGPEQLRLDEVVRQVLAARHDPRRVVADPEAGYFGARVGERTLVAGEGAQLAETRFADWLRTPAGVGR